MNAKSLDNFSVDGGASGAAVDGVALRLLNLFFALHVANEPLSTSEIVSNPSFNYASDNPETGLRKFRRDRERLGNLGVVIREFKEDGASEREESCWCIDDTLTFAHPHEVDIDDVEVAVAAINEHLSAQALDPSNEALRRARLKLEVLLGGRPDEGYGDQPGESSPADGFDSAASLDVESQEQIRRIWDAYQQRKAARFMYCKSGAEPVERTVELYGFFTTGTYTYAVGRRVDIDEVRTFRTDRIGKVWKASGKQPTYQIPADFSVGNYRFLPFDFSSHKPTRAKFLFSSDVPASEIAHITQGKGVLSSNRGGSTVWTVDVRDMDAAAAFVLEHASRGMQAIAPKDLVSRIHQRIAKAVEAHGE